MVAGMEYLLSSQFTWTGLLTIALELLALYFGLQFALRILANTSFLGNFQPLVRYALHHLLLIYEPLVILLLTSVFILINPVAHGLLFGLLLLTSFTQARDYLTGRLLQLNRNLSAGRTLKVRQKQGVIHQLGRLGVYLQTNEGIHFINYARLLSEGYTLTAGEEIGGFYYLRITGVEMTGKAGLDDQLTDLLATAPYIDWNHKPQFTFLDKDAGEVEARILVKEETHLHELMALIREKGYACRISPS